MLARPTHSLEEWNEYVREELSAVQQFLTALDVVLDSNQPHVGGEKHLFTTKKIVLLGTHTPSNTRVVIKASSKADGRAEIIHERRCRDAVESLDFGYSIFKSPREIAFMEEMSSVILVTEFIEEEKRFLEYSNKDQFFLALKAFESQEGVHATTFNHLHSIGRLLGITSTNNYIIQLGGYINEITSQEDMSVDTSNLETAHKLLIDYRDTIDIYSNFLSHVDFVPHNVRIRNNTIYILDHSDIHIANKYEGWARFLNYMILYNPTLETMFTTYVRNNRSKKENEVLRALRVFKAVELMAHYARTLPGAQDNEKSLNAERISFWSDVLENMLHGKPISSERVVQYKETRDNLRTEGEKKRQGELH